LDDLSLSVQPAEIFALLGPNGGGKTTLFRLLSTLVPLQQGQASVLGLDLRSQSAGVRAALGVVFQSPSLDRQLTVAENLTHQGHLYGLRGRPLAARIDDLLARFGLADRRRHLVQTLSGGLRRRVELAKGLLHQPRLLLLDEPSTGLDPGARRDLWSYLEQARRSDGLTVLLTTHLLDEADRADRLGILDQGRLVALGAPAELKSTLGGDTITLAAADPHLLARDLSARFQVAAQVVDGQVRLERRDAHQWISALVEAFPGRITSLRLSQPSLEDVFIARTGHGFAPLDEALDG
jgi:ABC-2 type transport system ATP-binding protein